MYALLYLSTADPIWESLASTATPASVLRSRTFSSLQLTNCSVPLSSLRLVVSGWRTATRTKRSSCRGCSSSSFTRTARWQQSWEVYGSLPRGTRQLLIPQSERRRCFGRTGPCCSTSPWRGLKTTGTSSIARLRALPLLTCLMALRQTACGRTSYDPERRLHVQWMTSWKRWRLRE
jgi:hypothetical protein